MVKKESSNSIWLHGCGRVSQNLSPVFFNQNVGILPVQFGRQGQPFIFYLTQDGGESWTTGKAADSNGEASNYQIIDNRHIVIIVSNHLYVSSDEGKTWQTMTMNQKLDRVDFIDPRNGFGYRGKTLYLTTNGGKTLKLIS